MLRMLCALWCAALLLGCDRGREATAPAAAEEGTSTEASPHVPTDAPDAPDPEAERQAALDRDFPLHGLVTGLQLQVRSAPSPEATVLGHLRIGSRVRLGPLADKTSTCASGWHPVAPRGFACAGEGIEVADAPPSSQLATAPPARDAGLPYAYYFVKEPKVPEYHRLPGRDDQRRAQEFLARYLELSEKKPERAAKLMAGELGDREPARPKVVKRFLERGFFVAGAGIETLKGRRFVRTVRGAYVQEAKLLPRTGTNFRGVELGVEVDGVTRQLPIAWATREAVPFNVSTRDDGSLRMLAPPQQQPYARQQIVPWEKEEHVGDVLLHRLQDGMYLKHWFLAVARRIERPRGIEPGQRWVHVNLDQQTLVAYVGDDPVYATLVSSGLPEHETPTGLFTITAKHVAATMRDIGPEVGEDDRYSIEDVPWTQYFSGSVALHGAFWHERFGLQRSHGCVNLAPRDAHYLFDHTAPPVTDGWHSVFPEPSGLSASKVWVTSK